MNDNFEYKVYQYGNYPVMTNAKPKNTTWRIKLPAEADWTGGVAGSARELAELEEDGGERSYR